MYSIDLSLLSPPKTGSSFQFTVFYKMWKLFSLFTVHSFTVLFRVYKFPFERRRADFSAGWTKMRCQETKQCLFAKAPCFVMLCSTAVRTVLHLQGTPAGGNPAARDTEGVIPSCLGLLRSYGITLPRKGSGRFGWKGAGKIVQGSWWGAGNDQSSWPSRTCWISTSTVKLSSQDHLRPQPPPLSQDRTALGSWLSGLHVSTSQSRWTFPRDSAHVWNSSGFKQYHLALSVMA